MENSFQQQMPQTVLVPQPVRILQGVPYMRRGAVVSDGMKIGAGTMICLMVVGVVVLFLGLLFAFVSWGLLRFVGIILAIVGALFTIGGCYLRSMASSQFEALPADHPDRIKHSTGVYRYLRGHHAYTTCNVPPGAQVVTYPLVIGPNGEPAPDPQNQPRGYPVTQMGQPGYNPSVHPGQHGYNPNMASGPGYNPNMTMGQPGYNPNMTMGQPGYNPNMASGQQSPGQPGYYPSYSTGQQPMGQPLYNPCTSPGQPPMGQPVYNPNNPQPTPESPPIINSASTPAPEKDLPPSYSDLGLS